MYIVAALAGHKQRDTAKRLTYLTRQQPKDRVPGARATERKMLASMCSTRREAVHGFVKKET